MEAENEQKTASVTSVRVQGVVRNLSSPREGDFIPADNRPKNGGWHWPTYWQVMAEEAKEIPNDEAEARRSRGMKKPQGFPASLRAPCSATGV